MRRLLPIALLVLLLAACGEPDTPPLEEDPDLGAPGAEPGFEDFDRDTARAEAEALLGTPEHDVAEGPLVRIVRRGDEEYIVTMDLRPGRMNLELDDDGTGTYVVTRIVVEDPDDDPLVVE
jgi:hypothetical protein